MFSIARCEVISIMPHAFTFANPIGKKDVPVRVNRLIRIETVLLYWPLTAVKPLWIIVTILAAGALCGAEKKPKPPDVEVLEASAHRGETRISLDGRVRNTGEKQIKKLTIIFHFMAPGKQVITSQSAAVDEELLAPGEESVFHMELND